MTHKQIPLLLPMKKKKPKIPRPIFLGKTAGIPKQLAEGQNQTQGKGSTKMKNIKCMHTITNDIEPTHKLYYFVFWA